MKTESLSIPTNALLVATNPQLLDTMELFLDKGRKFLQKTFQAKLQERVDGCVLAVGASEQNRGTLCRSLFQPVETMLKIYPLKFYTPHPV